MKTFFAAFGVGGFVAFLLLLLVDALAQPTSSTRLRDLNDVKVASTPANGAVLTYNSSLNRWTNGPSIGGGSGGLSTNVVENTWTTNAPGKAPSLLSTTTSPLYPLMILKPDGSGSPRTVSYAPNFFMSNGIAFFEGDVIPENIGGGSLVRTIGSGALRGTTLVPSDIPALDATNITSGTLATARLGSGTANSTTVLGGDQAYRQIADAQVSASAAIAWSKLSKTGSSLADFDTRSAGDLSSGTISTNRLPANVADLGNLTPTAGDLLYYDGTHWQRLGGSTSGYVLTANGASTAPSYQAPSSTITGSGSANTVTKWTGANTLGSIANGAEGTLLGISNGLPAYIAGGGDTTNPVQNFYSTSNYFTVGKGGKLTVTNGITTLDVAASSLLRVDSNQKIAAAAIGSGLSFDGTTLSATTSAGATPGFTISSSLISANQTNIDNGTAGTNAFVIVGGSGNSTTNGNNLLAAYTWAKAATPNGAVKSAANRFTILLLPGVYNLGSQTLTMDTAYIDVVGLSTDTGQTVYVSSWSNLGDTVIKSTGTVINVTVANASVVIENVCLQNTGSSGSAYCLNWPSAMSDFLIKNVLMRYDSSANPPHPMPEDKSVGGTWIDVRCWYDSAFGEAVSSAITVNGTFIRCKSGASGFGGAVGIAIGSDASGTFIDCEGDSNSFGNSTCSGTFIGCRLVSIGGGGASLFASRAGSTCSGTFINCTTDSGTGNWGNGGTFSGTMRNCAGGISSTITGTISDSTLGGHAYTTSVVKEKAGTSTGFVRVGGALKTDTTTTGNVGGGEDNLITFSVPANTLAANGDCLDFDCWGSFAANANTKDLKIYFGATTLYDSTALIFNGIDWRGHGKIVRTGAATQIATCEFTLGGTLLGAVTTTTATTSAPAETLANAITFKVTGTDSGGVPVNDSIVQKAMVLRWYAASP